MMIRKRGLVGGLLATLLLVSGTAMADGHGSSEVMLVTGKHWVESDERAKIGYLYGIANFAHIERAMHGDDMSDDKDSLIPVLVRGLDGKSVDDVKADLDALYESNPDKIDRPVLETIYLELALPNS